MNPMNPQPAPALPENVRKTLIGVLNEHARNCPIHPEGKLAIFGSGMLLNSLVAALAPLWPVAPTGSGREERKPGSAPKEIFLQWNGDQEPDEDAEPAEVTWAKEQIFPHDVKYVLATPAAPQEQKPDSKHNELPLVIKTNAEGEKVFEFMTPGLDVMLEEALDGEVALMARVPGTGRCFWWTLGKAAPLPQPSAQEGKTAETYAEVARIFDVLPTDPHGQRIGLMAAFARTLERQRDEARRQLTTQREAHEREIKVWQERNAQQLAACDCAAMMDTPETHEKNKVVTRDNPFWSPAFESVMRRTAECIKLRQELSALRTKLKESGALLERARTYTAGHSNNVASHLHKDLVAALRAIEEGKP
jgi:hypothetical protein